MKKILAIVIAVLMIGALAVTFTACGDDTPEVFEKTLTATEAEDYVFGANGAINNGGKVFNVKATFSGHANGSTSCGETILVLDTTEGENFASIYDNQTSKDDDDGEITNKTEFLFINWTERSNGTLKNNGVVHAYSIDGETPVSNLLASGYEGLQNNLLKNSGLQGGKSVLENQIHNPNEDVYDTLQYTAKAIYNDSSMTDLNKVEVTITYHYEDDDQIINGTANIVMSMREVTIYDGTTKTLLVFDSIVVAESVGNNMTINYVYGVDSLGAPDFDDLSGTWPEAYPLA